MADEQNPSVADDAISRDRLDLRAVAGVDRMLDIPVQGGGWQQFPIPGDLSVPTLARLLVIENKINDAEAEQLEEVMDDALNEVMRIIRARTPDAPDPDKDEFGVRRISAAIAWIAGETSVAESFRVTLTAGVAPPEVDNAVATSHTGPDVETTDESAEEADPLASNELSSTRSSGSDDSTAGDQSGGGSAAGEPSDSTSPTLTSV